MQVASQYGLEMNWKKSQLVVKRVEYLGHIIENGQVKPSPDNIEAIKKFRKYLFGIKFKIVTDCKAFQMTLMKRDMSTSTRVARWIMLLQEYNFTVEHRKGSQMRHADALSRNHYVAMITSDFQEKLKQAQLRDVALKAVMEILKERPYEEYWLENGLLFKGPEKHLVVPIVGGLLPLHLTYPPTLLSHHQNPVSLFLLYLTPMGRMKIWKSTTVNLRAKSTQAKMTQLAPKRSKPVLVEPTTPVQTGPLFVHVSRIEADPQAGSYMHPIKFGQLLMKLKIKKILQDGIKKVGRNRVAVEFRSADAANAFIINPNLIIKGNVTSIPTWYPIYNITRMGLVKEVPSEWSEEEVKNNLTLPTDCGEIL
ncbi:uncharacterized protein LOC125489446 [Plutella xylostella]|uniref:uncharacterized protein LOC125489446 n=1 Tax=Plutella xylostella TaxID=51655 RepID=UPI0020330054|nr:uncharacterized protein LOC125489446 [Plutella xylostella]